MAPLDQGSCREVLASQFGWHQIHAGEVSAGHFLCISAVQDSQISYCVVLQSTEISKLSEEDPKKQMFKMAIVYCIDYVVYKCKAGGHPFPEAWGQNGINTKLNK